MGLLEKNKLAKNNSTTNSNPGLAQAQAKQTGVRLKLKTYFTQDLSS
jgi:hypothetical protein